MNQRPTGAIAPFETHINENVLADLKQRINRTRWPDPSPAPPWAHGTDLETLQAFCAYWANRFDWAKSERAINQWPQFQTSVDGQPIHAFHIRSAEPTAHPLLLLHGWPSTNTEFLKVFGPLADPTAHGGRVGEAFHVVCPSLPGFGWSSPMRRSGWTPHRMAGALVELMGRLGYERFGVHGGDWGSMVASQLGLHFPERITGIHLNLVIAPQPKGLDDPLAGLTEAERRRLAEMRARGTDEMGYQAIQATKPAGLSAGLNDSPAGLAGWILEKFRSWGDTRGDLTSRFSFDELSSLCTIYWATGTIWSANGLYAETRRSGKGSSAPDAFVGVPMAYSRFPADGFASPRAWVERLYDVRQWHEHDEGGHFPALEVPNALIGDLRGFFPDLGSIRVARP